MANLIIPIEKLREGPLVLEVNIRPEVIDLTDEEFKFSGRVAGSVVFKIVGSSDVLGLGELRAQAVTPCVRCLEPAQVDIHVKVEETWLKSSPEEQMDQEFNAEEPLTRAYFEDEVELDEAFRELIMADLPDRPLCKPDCKGLCPGCGVNLNVEPCRCAPEVREAREEEQLPEWKRALKKLGSPRGSDHR